MSIKKLSKVLVLSSAIMTPAMTMGSGQDVDSKSAAPFSVSSASSTQGVKPVLERSDSSASSAQQNVKPVLERSGSYYHRDNAVVLKELQKNINNMSQAQVDDEYKIAADEDDIETMKWLLSLPDGKGKPTQEAINAAFLTAVGNYPRSFCYEDILGLPVGRGMPDQATIDSAYLSVRNTDKVSVKNDLEKHVSQSLKTRYNIR